MSNGGSRTYLIEHWVRSNLRSHQGKPFTFEVDGAKVAVVPPAASDEADGFVTQTQLQGDAVLLAERAAHDAVTAMLDVLCYEMRVTGLVVRSVRSQVEGSGPTRRCVVYGHEPRRRPLFLMAHCEYRTEFASEAFPPDCPTFGEVKEYEEAIRRGRQHPKIINLLPPTDW